MQTHKYDNAIIALLISPRFRIVRHLLLFACAFSISIGNVYYAIEHGSLLSAFEKFGILLCFGIVVLVSCYLNIYVLVPKLLFRNKWGWYFLSLLGTTLVIIFILLLLSLYIGSSSITFEGDEVNIKHLFKGIINLLSSLLAFFVFLAGTSTLALFKKWIMEMKQAEELESSTLQMELKLLENQINPHFLFNMLNNANIMVKSNPDMAIHIIRKLKEMLHYLMSESDSERVNLEDELVFLDDFLELEKTRRDAFDYRITNEGNAEHLQVAPLLFIPFVENAVKHSQDSRAASFVHIVFKTERGRLMFICKNSIPRNISDKKVGGLGLANISRRLNLLYKGKYTLEQSKTDSTYTVRLELKR